MLVSNLKCKVEGTGGPTPSRKFFLSEACRNIWDTFHQFLTAELWLKLVGLLIIDIIGNA